MASNERNVSIWRHHHDTDKFRTHKIPHFSPLHVIYGVFIVSAKVMKLMELDQTNIYLLDRHIAIVSLEIFSPIKMRWEWICLISSTKALQNSVHVATVSSWHVQNFVCGIYFNKLIYTYKYIYIDFKIRVKNLTWNRALVNTMTSNLAVSKRQPNGWWIRGLL